jgi:hypothetical protein
MSAGLGVFLSWSRPLLRGPHPFLSVFVSSDRCLSVWACFCVEADLSSEARITACLCLYHLSDVCPYLCLPCSGRSLCAFLLSQLTILSWRCKHCFSQTTWRCIQGDSAHRHCPENRRSHICVTVSWRTDTQSQAQSHWPHVVTTEQVFLAVTSSVRIPPLSVWSPVTLTGLL